MQSKVLATEISRTCNNLFHFIIGLLMVECIAFLSSQICVVPFSFLSGSNTIKFLVQAAGYFKQLAQLFDSVFIVYKATLFHGHL